MTDLTRLNDPDRQERLAALWELAGKVRTGEIPRPATGKDVNNHIHTTYSFSPYSPSKAVWMAYQAGLSTAGIMDHDSISGAREFIEAGRIVGLATTIGIECRVRMDRTPLFGRRTNNPDQTSISYVAIHGIPHQGIDRAAAFFRPYVEARNVRNRAMTERINRMMEPAGVSIDFDRDVLPLSMHRDGGSVTERHLLYALSLKVIAKYGKGRPVVGLLKDGMGLEPGAKIEAMLSDPDDPYYDYDLLGAFKKDLVARFYVDAWDECPEISDYLSLTRELGAIAAYPYLGDVGESVTGDKKAQTFEDAYLDELFEVIRDLGFQAVAYMPSRNTREQLARLRERCEAGGFMQISGEDINTPRQKFVCEAQRAPEFANLYDSTWALIGHEIAATADIGAGMFSPATIRRLPALSDRIAAFKAIGLASVEG
jgi:hypothetical protein